MDLTKKQRAIYEFLKEYRRENGMPPSYEEIRRKFGFASLNSARKHLLQLHRKGYIKSPWKNQKRALVIVRREEDPTAVNLPLLGTVAAGRPLDASETQDLVPVPESLLRQGEHFALRVSGSSMVEDGILDGDVLVVQSRDTADPGQTVVALVDGEATVKRFYRQGDSIELRPANPRFEPIVVKPELVNLRGVVVGLVRKFA
ncbi:MAG TPA: transcriptional repressor LexA [Vicinamibacteria bacterium]|nr:transcriptional repressor LexA [Vicinamibacteria bacterium]